MYQDSFVFLFFFWHMNTQFSNTIYENTSLAPLYGLCFFVKHQLTIFFC